MEETEWICRTVLAQTGSVPERCFPAGKGASGSVYRIELKDGRVLAVKRSAYEDLAREEYEGLTFLRAHSPLPSPEPYFLCPAEQEKPEWLIGMEWIDGISAENPLLRFHGREKRENYVRSILSALKRLQSVTNMRFGEIGGPLYDSWDAYYQPFALQQLEFARQSRREERLAPEVLEAMEMAFSCYGKIFAQEPRHAVLTHGDFWTPNMLMDPKTLELRAVLDPFRVKWADPDYELFALKVGAGARFHLYERYKERMGIGAEADVKTEFYALFSEIFWYSRLGSISHPFLKDKSRSLLREMKRRGIRA